MHYLADRASRIAAELPAVPRDRASWEQRRESVRRHLSHVLGLPLREPMRAKTLATRRDGDLVVEDVMYLWAERAYVSANVIRPAGTVQPGAVQQPLPAVVMPPGWLGELKYEYYSTFVYHAARNGYLVIFIDDPHVGKRAAPCAGLYGAAGAAGTQVMGIQVFDTLRALDYLLTRSDVDPERIGVAGLCQGSEQTWLAAALEDRFKIAVPVCGTTTYEEWVRMPISVPTDLSDPSPYVAGILRWTDWHETNACIAPRPVFIASNSGDNWWPVPGYNKVIETLDRVFALYGQPERFRHLRELRSHSLTPFIPELAPWIDRHLKHLPASASVSPKPIGEPIGPDFSMLHYCQRRIVRQTEAMPQSFADAKAWERFRQPLVQWLREACDMKGLRPGPANAESRVVVDGLVRETITLPQAPGLSDPALVVFAEASASPSRPAVVLSHDSLQCLADKDVLNFAAVLARDGYLVCVPEHVSTHRQSRRHLPHFISLYGAGDTVELPPLSMRVWDDCCAVGYLRQRADVAGQPIAIVGLGIGGVDAAVCAAIEPQIAACGAVGAITVRDWAEQVAPTRDKFDRIMPYLPDLAVKADLQHVYAAVAPRPLLLVDATDRPNWPEAAFERVSRMAGSVYTLSGSRQRLAAVPSRSAYGVEEVRSWLRIALKPQ
jgi:dienelactone hydrolase